MSGRRQGSIAMPLTVLCIDLTSSATQPASADRRGSVCWGVGGGTEDGMEAESTTGEVVVFGLVYFQSNLQSIKHWKAHSRGPNLTPPMEVILSL